MKEKKRYIQMHEVAEELGDTMSQALPVIHALSGCDSTSSFYGVGKKRWLTTLEKHPAVLEGIMELGNHPTDMTETAKQSANQAVSVLYTGKSMCNTDDVRYELFSKKGIQ